MSLKSGVHGLLAKAFTILDLETNKNEKLVTIPISEPREQTSTWRAERNLGDVPVVSVSQLPRELP